VEPPDLKVGDMVPDFKLKNAITGETFSYIKDFKGKKPYSVVVFMNTGCSSCLAELMELKDALKDKKDQVNFVAIAVDKRGEEVVKAYYDNYKIDATYLVDANFTIPPLFGFSYTPAMFISENGKIIFMKGGYNPNRDQGKLAEQVNKVIK
jgi:peroxiredoxin